MGWGKRGMDFWGCPQQGNVGVSWECRDPSLCQPHPCVPGHGERGQCPLQGAVGAQTWLPAAHQPAAAPVHGAGRVPGDRAPRSQRGGAQGVPPGEDVSAPGQVGAAWGAEGAAMGSAGIAVPWTSLEACPRGICPHSWNWAFPVGAMGCSWPLWVTASPSSPLPGVPCA